MNGVCTSNDKKIGIVLFSNRKYLFALGTFIVNLQQYIPYDGLIIYHEGFTDSEIEAIYKIEPKSKFIKYGVSELSREFDFDENTIGLFDIKRFSIYPIIKFKIFQHLNEFSTVMFFDLDMVILGDMEDLLEREFDIAWRIDAAQTIRFKLNRWGVSDNFIREIGMYDAYNDIETPNAGFFVLKRTFDYQRIYKECVNYLRNYSFKHPFQIDEILFGYIASVMKLNVYYVDDRVYDVYPDSVNTKSKLIHFLGIYKPWNNQMVQAVFPDWRRCYEKYVSLTNMPSDEVIIFNNISECLLQRHYRDTWGHLFKELNFIYPSQLEMMPELSSHKLDFSACFKNSHLMFKNPWKEQKTTPSCAA